MNIVRFLRPKHYQEVQSLLDTLQMLDNLPDQCLPCKSCPNQCFCSQYLYAAQHSEFTTRAPCGKVSVPDNLVALA